MSKKHFSWLMIVTLVAAGLVLLIPEKTGDEVTLDNDLLLPGMAEAANDLEYVRLIAAGNETVATLERIEGQWQVSELQSYPADWERLKTLLSALSQASIVEQKTGNPDLYPRLGVEDVAAQNASGMLVEFSESAGLSAVIVGNSATGRDGQYVRLAGEANSFLIDRKIELPADRMQWVNRDVIDIARDEVVEASITHPDGAIVKVMKKSADDANFELLDVPEGREPASNWSVNALGGGLSSLRLDEVVSDTAIDWSSSVVFSVVTTDGMRANGWLVNHQEGAWIRLGASVYQAMGEQAEAESGEPDEFKEALTNRVNEINERVSGWAYRIPQSAFDTMTRRPEDLLKPVDEA